MAKTKTNDNSANLGFEAKPWLAADKLPNNIDAPSPPCTTRFCLSC